ncbi:BTAD domain-containing putative transcriptional regulator [Kribbella sp. NPDC026611]|uniref:AfsR/SARP family transcriptional regulator n=1 Tax=Kribbella sp. NPDC026611 TaxID=3154911 RepID=UPI0033D3F82E
MEFRLLGPVEIWTDGKLVGLKRRQERLLLAVLLLAAGKPVPADRLMELLWPDALPANPRRALQVYMSRLRAVLDVELTSGQAGYAIQTPPGSTDVEQFTTLVAQARMQDELERRSKLLTDALQLWRGPALADVTTEDVRRRLVGGLEEARWAAEELRLTTELALGHHQELLPALAELAAAQPARETFTSALMLALYRSGRQADALAAYTDLVRYLDEELGVEPGSELRELQVAILRQDPSLDFTTASVVPRELPPDVGLLVGRDDVLRELSSVLQGAGHPGVPAVVCLYGAAGTGKSTAAVRLGHELADRYPDGQLFARLQDVDGQAREVRTVLGQLLRSLGVDDVPDTVDEGSALLRSRVADKAVLLVLDDAVDAGQLRPLLPATVGCGVVVTSRQPMLGLEDATHRELGPLPDDTSAALLGTLSGLGNDEVADLVPHCAGLPLALRIVGARLALVREDVAEVAKKLADESQRLDYLVAGDRAVRASLRLTLSVAGPEARELFARIAVVDADDFGAWVAAPLLGLEDTAATAVLESLVSLGLVQVRRLEPKRYGLHGLVRALSRELYADDQEVEQRYLETLLRLVVIAEAEMDEPVETAVAVELAEETLLTAELDAARAGARWLDNETQVLRSGVRLAARRSSRTAGLLGVRLAGFLTVRDLREARIDILETARDATAADGLVDLEAELDRALFGAYAHDDRPLDEMARQADRCLDSATRAGSTELRGMALNQVAWTAIQTCDFERALAVADEMLAIADAGSGNPALRMKALDQRSAALFHLGRVAESLEARRATVDAGTPGTRIHAIRLILLAEFLLDDDLGRPHAEELTRLVAEAREIVERIGDTLGRAHVDNTDAMTRIAAGRPAGADELLDRASETFAQHPDPAGEAENTVGRARLAVAEGRPADASRLLETALAAVPEGLERRELELQKRLLGL